MAITIGKHRRLDAEDEAWECAHPLPPRSLAPPPPAVLDRIGAGTKAGIKYAVSAVKIVALATVVVFFVLPYALTALTVAGGAILALRILRYCRGPGPSASTMVPSRIRGGSD